MAKFKKPKTTDNIDRSTSASVLSATAKELGETGMSNVYADAEAEAKANATCPRCKGDGVWHSTKTGYRAKTSAEPLVDPTRPCPECDGKK